MNRRRFLVGAGAAAAATAGYAGVRVGDRRPYDPDPPTGETPRERIVAAAAHRFAADHRVVSRAEIRRDWTGEAPYALGVHRQWYEHSRRRHLHAFTALDAPLFERVTTDEAPSAEFLSPHGNLPAVLHYNRAFGAASLPLTYVLHVTDGRLLYDFDAPTPPAGANADEIRVTGEEGRSGVGLRHADDDPAFREYVRPHRAAWERVRDDGDTVTYRVAGPDAYAQVVPLALTAVRGFADPFVEVTLDRETGRLRRVVDHRDVLVDGRAAGGGSDGAAPDADGEAGGDAQRDGGGPSRRLTYRIETAFDGYGTARAPRPSGDVGADVETRVKGFLMDLFTY